jgi:hypothetical protein
VGLFIKGRGVVGNGCGVPMWLPRLLLEGWLVVEYLA